MSISVPVLDEAKNIAALYRRLCDTAKRMQDKCDLEFIFTDNHSSDETWSKLAELAKIDPRVRALRFSKNVGFQRSILANYIHSRGDAVMQIDADLQDPPELLETFFDLWQRGYKVVYGIRAERPESAFLKGFRKFGYRLINAVSEHAIPPDAGDFRLVDRCVVEALAKFKSPNPYLRGMIAGLGFEQIGIKYERSARIAGESKFNVTRLVRLGLTAVFNHSAVPLRFCSLLGAAMLAASFIGAAYYVLLKLLQPTLPQGLASIHILVLFGIGLHSFLLGIIGEYIFRIYVILRAEPLAIIERTLNFPSEELRL